MSIEPRFVPGTIYRLIWPTSGAAMRVTSLSCQAAAPLLAPRDTKDKRPCVDDGIARARHGVEFPFPASLAAAQVRVAPAPTRRTAQRGVCTRQIDR